MSDEYLLGIMRKKEYSADNRPGRQFKIQVIICQECEKTLGARFVLSQMDDTDYGYCSLCILSICDFSGFLELNHIPRTNDFNIAYSTDDDPLYLQTRCREWRYSVIRALDRLWNARNRDKI